MGPISPQTGPNSLIVLNGAFRGLRGGSPIDPLRDESWSIFELWLLAASGELRSRSTLAAGSLSLGCILSGWEQLRVGRVHRKEMLLTASACLAPLIGRMPSSCLHRGDRSIRSITLAWASGLATTWAFSENRRSLTLCRRRRGGWHQTVGTHGACRHFQLYLLDSAVCDSVAPPILDKAMFSGAEPVFHT